MTKYVALRERNQPRIGFPPLMESPEPLDCLSVYITLHGESDDEQR